MKSRLLIGFCALALSGLAQGYFVPSGVTYVGLNFLGGYEIRVRQDPATADYTGFMLKPEGKTPPSSPFVNTFSFDGYVDETVRVFLVASNQPVSLQPIAANAYSELTFGNSYVFANNSPFYVGLYTGPCWTQLPPTNPITYDDPLFGWARLVNNQGVIQMLDSALEHGGGGIASEISITIVSGGNWLGGPLQIK